MIRGSVANSGLNSYNNSSDESARGGSTNSLRGRQMKTKGTAKNGIEQRNRSSDNHYHNY